MELVYVIRGLISNDNPEIVTYVGRIPGDIAEIIDPSGSKPGSKYVLVVPTETV